MNKLNFNLDEDTIFNAKITSLAAQMTGNNMHMRIYQNCLWSIYQYFEYYICHLRLLRPPSALDLVGALTAWFLSTLLWADAGPTACWLVTGWSLVEVFSAFPDKTLLCTGLMSDSCNCLGSTACLTWLAALHVLRASCVLKWTADLIGPGCETSCLPCFCCSFCNRSLDLSAGVSLLTTCAHTNPYGPCLLLLSWGTQHCILDR